MTLTAGVPKATAYRPQTDTLLRVLWCSIVGADGLPGEVTFSVCPSIQDVRCGGCVGPMRTGSVFVVLGRALAQAFGRGLRDY
jgi:hypothetical protein